jgi:hypothetical protein
VPPPVNTLGSPTAAWLRSIRPVVSMLPPD